jgi:hypothetical protein
MKSLLAWRWKWAQPPVTLHQASEGAIKSRTRVIPSAARNLALPLGVGDGGGNQSEIPRCARNDTGGKVVPFADILTPSLYGGVAGDIFAFSSTVTRVNLAV